MAYVWLLLPSEPVYVLELPSPQSTYRLDAPATYIVKVCDAPVVCTVHAPWLEPQLTVLEVDPPVVTIVLPPDESMSVAST